MLRILIGHDRFSLKPILHIATVFSAVPLIQFIGCLRNPTAEIIGQSVQIPPR
jgi:hypothetical protein